jgi:hypothetical protein
MDIKKNVKELIMKCPESIEELERLEQMLPLCRESLFEQAQARIKIGEAKSERQAAKQLAEELGVPEQEGAIHHKIHRERTKRESVPRGTPSIRSRDSKEGGMTVPPQCGTKRPKDFPRTKELVSDKFKEAFEAFCTAITNEKSLGWKTTSQKVALKYVEMLHDVITIK